MRSDGHHIRGEADAEGYTFNFQLAQSGTRKACSVSVQARNSHDATDFFQKNWPAIEAMARERLINGTQARLRLEAP
jgi:hypothetical protein